MVCCSTLQCTYERSNENSFFYSLTPRKDPERLLRAHPAAEEPAGTALATSFRSTVPTAYRENSCHRLLLTDQSSFRRKGGRNVSNKKRLCAFVWLANGLKRSMVERRELSGPKHRLQTWSEPGNDVKVEQADGQLLLQLQLSAAQGKNNASNYSISGRLHTRSFMGSPSLFTKL